MGLFSRSMPRTYLDILVHLPKNATPPTPDDVWDYYLSSGSTEVIWKDEHSGFATHVRLNYEFTQPDTNPTDEGPEGGPSNRNSGSAIS